MRYRFPYVGADLRKPTRQPGISEHSETMDVIRVGAPRDMPVYFPAFAGTKLYCLVTEAVGCEQLA